MEGTPTLTLGIGCATGLPWNWRMAYAFRQANPPDRIPSYGNQRSYYPRNLASSRPCPLATVARSRIARAGPNAAGKPGTLAGLGERNGDSQGTGERRQAPLRAVHTAARGGPRPVPDQREHGRFH